MATQCSTTEFLGYRRSNSAIFSAIIKSWAISGSFFWHATRHLFLALTWIFNIQFSFVFHLPKHSRIDGSLQSDIVRTHWIMNERQKTKKWIKHIKRNFKIWKIYSAVPKKDATAVHCAASQWGDAATVEVKRVLNRSMWNGNSFKWLNFASLGNEYLHYVTSAPFETRNLCTCTTHSKLFDWMNLVLCCPHL